MTDVAATILDQGDPDGVNPTRDQPIAPDGRPELGRLYRIAPRQGRAVRIGRGQTITVVNTHGNQVCDFWAFCEADAREYLSMEHLRTHLSRIIPRPGDELVTNRRRTILTFIEDTSPGVHDTVVAACDLQRYRQLGVEAYHDNCTDNLRLAMLAIGRRAREIPSPLNLWMNTPVRADGTIAWLATVSGPGDRVVFRAELDCLAVMSACPQDMVPINSAGGAAPTELHFQID